MARYGPQEGEGLVGGLEVQSEATVKRTVLFLRRFGRSDFNLTSWGGTPPLNLRIRIESKLFP
jgi:hypothetical protein